MPAVKMEFYTCTDDEKTINKSLLYKFSINNVLWKEDTDIIHPVFTFAKDQNWKQFNYVCMKWEGWTDRYYFVKNYIVKPGGIIEIVCEEDYRYTWKNDILSMFCLVSRQENLYNRAIVDERKKIPEGRMICSKAIGDVGDDDSTFVLTVTTG